MTLSSLANVAVKPFNYARNSFSQLSRQNKTVVLVAGVSALALTILDANRALNLQKKVRINEDLLGSWQLRVSNYKVLKQLRMDTSAESSLSSLQLPPLVENTPLSWKFIFSYWPAARLEKNACGYLALAQEVKK
ncbi:MAG: hypothetical protein L7U87_02215 [Chlamydiales bacterium]|nr:hypothetical protein [Chlamydiales bacterium]